MDLDARATVRIDRPRVLAALADLGTYPHWLTIVGAAEAVGPAAWDVELRGRFGPFTKTKRVRMVRTDHDEDRGTVRFEREERDGREHNAWILTGSATTASTDGATDVHVHLHYGGGLLVPGADLLLRREVADAGRRLQAHLEERRR